MKKYFVLVLLGMLLTCRAQSQTEDSSQTIDITKQSPFLSSWYLGEGLGVNLPVTDWNHDFILAGGGEVFGGYRLDHNFALQVDLMPWFFTGGGLSVWDSRIFADVRLSFPSNGVCPYLLAGPGYDLQYSSPAGKGSSSLAAMGGLGIQLEVRPGEYLFFEGRYNFLIYQNLTQQDIPITWGLLEDL